MATILWRLMHRTPEGPIIQYWRKGAVCLALSVCVGTTRLVAQARPPLFILPEPRTWNDQRGGYVLEVSTLALNRFVAPRLRLGTQLRIQLARDSLCVDSVVGRNITICNRTLLDLNHPDELGRSLSFEGQVDVVAFILLHEFGHYVVATRRIALPGDEEAAVDELATLLLLDIREPPLGAINFFGQLAETERSTEAETTHHGTSLRRAARLRCLAAGWWRRMGVTASPSDDAYIAQWARVSQERVNECRNEYRRARQTWLRLLSGVWDPASPSD